MPFPDRALSTAPPDAIFGISEAYARDPRPDKVNLAVGVYVDERGATPVLPTVLAAEQRLVDRASSKTYRPIDGAPGFRAAVRELIFGAGSATVESGRALTAQTPGGTGALRVAADFLAQTGGGRTAWLPTPTWPNHLQLFGLAGYRVVRYPYLDPAGRAIDGRALLGALAAADRGDVVVLHGSCHNPSGIDPSPELWAEIADTLVARGLQPIIDFAYQGFGRGLREDADWLAALDRPKLELLVCSSYSKNFSLYNERVGALTVLAADGDRAAAALSHVKIAIRANYSNPPSHGADIVELILGDPDLRPAWEIELAGMRQRIAANRSALVDVLIERDVPGEWQSLRGQRGMFALLGLSDAAVTRLRTEHAVYMTGGGRINLAGLTPANLGRTADAVAAALNGR
jgi:aspartate/tyrosine/aromatic aminotransferase